MATHDGWYFDIISALERAEAEAERLRAERDSFQRVGIKAGLEVERLRAELDELVQSCSSLREDTTRAPRPEVLWRAREALKGGEESYRLVPNEQTTSSSSWVEGGGE
jgi:hypothetical protein